MQAYRRVHRNNGTTLIVVLTETGRAANLISKYRPPCLVVVASTNQQVAIAMKSLTWHCMSWRVMCDVLGEPWADAWQTCSDAETNAQLLAR